MHRVFYSLPVSAISAPALYTIFFLSILVCVRDKFSLYFSSQIDSPIYIKISHTHTCMVYKN